MGALKGAQRTQQGRAQLSFLHSFNKHPLCTGVELGPGDSGDAAGAEARPGSAQQEGQVGLHTDS